MGRKLEIWEWQVIADNLRWTNWGLINSSVMFSQSVGAEASVNIMAALDALRRFRRDAFKAMSSQFGKEIARQKFFPVPGEPNGGGDDCGEWHELPEGFSYEIGKFLRK